VNLKNAGDHLRASAAQQREREKEQTNERCGKSPEVYQSPARRDHDDIVVASPSGRAVDKLPGARGWLFWDPGAREREEDR
jgi:hypothetical protein